MELIWVFIVLGFVGRLFGKKKDKKNKSISKPTSASPVQSRPQQAKPVPHQQFIPTPAPAAHGHNPDVIERRSNYQTVVHDFEDRRNDWLAQEIREENNKIKEMCHMFDLKQQHEIRCGADRIDPATY